MAITAACRPLVALPSQRRVLGNGAVHGLSGLMDGLMDGWRRVRNAVVLWPYGVLCVRVRVRVQTEGVKRGQQPLRAALAVTLVR